MLLLIGVYLVRTQVGVQPLLCAPFCIFPVSNFAGMFGWYQTYRTGIENDNWVYGFLVLWLY